MSRFSITLLLLSLAPLFSFSQRISPSDKDFNFVNGIYFTIESYKENRPSIATEQMCDKDGKELLDYQLKATIYYKNDSNTVKSIRTADIFGYAERGDFYIKLIYNKGVYFPKLVVVGSLSHFVCEVQDVSYNGYANYGPGTITNYSLQQFLFDYETGVINNFDQENFLLRLQRDTELYTEFMTLSKKKKKESMFLYLRKYNERHKVDFPVNR